MINKKQIKITGNGNIAIQGLDNSILHINTNDMKDVNAKLETFEKEDLSELQKIISTEQHQLSEKFMSSLKDWIFQKNAVGGNISNIGGNVTIGDRIIHEADKENIPKELSSQMPLTRLDRIVGRRTELKNLHQRLFDNKQVVLVNGMGGIGKTTMAQVYASEYYESYKHIAWISQISENIIDDFINTEGLWRNLNIEKKDQKPKALFLEIINKLKGIKASEPCLLILDNATSKLQEIWNYLPHQPQWHILATSREIIPEFDLMELDFLNEADAISLFKKHYHRAKLDDDFLKNWSRISNTTPSL